MLKILGWIIVIWLFGSTIYSTQFHLRNYFGSKDRDSIIAKDLETPAQQLLMNKKEFFRRVLSMQIVKIVFMCFLIYFLLNRL